MDEEKSASTPEQKETKDKGDNIWKIFSLLLLIIILLALIGGGIYYVSKRTNLPLPEETPVSETEEYKNVEGSSTDKTATPSSSPTSTPTSSPSISPTATSTSTSTISPTLKLKSPEYKIYIPTPTP